MGIDGLRRGEKGLPHEARLDPFGEGHRGSSNHSPSKMVPMRKMKRPRPGRAGPGHGVVPMGSILGIVDGASVSIRGWWIVGMQ